MGLEKPKHEDKQVDDILIEREPEEYTFKPNLYLTQGGRRSRSVSPDIKSISPSRNA